MKTAAAQQDTGWGEKCRAPFGPHARPGSPSGDRDTRTNGKPFEDAILAKVGVSRVVAASKVDERAEGRQNIK